MELAPGESPLPYSKIPQWKKDFVKFATPEIFKNLISKEDLENWYFSVIEGNRPDLLKFLLKHHPQISRNQDYLYTAVNFNHVNLVKAMLDESLGQRFSIGVDAIFAAVHTQNLDMIDALRAHCGYFEQEGIQAYWRWFDRKVLEGQ